MRRGPAEAGELLVNGEPVTFHSPEGLAASAGIEVVYQDLALATELSVAENIFLGRERRRDGLLRGLRILDRSRMAKEAAEALESLAIEIHSVRAR